MAIQQVMQKIERYDYDEIMEICSNTWVDAVFSISEKDVRTISRLIRSQEKFAVYESHLPVVQVTAS
jgi:hypothetical protein